MVWEKGERIILLGFFVVLAVLIIKFRMATNYDYNMLVHFWHFSPEFAHSLISFGLKSSYFLLTVGSLVQLFMIIFGEESLERK